MIPAALVPLCPECHREIGLRYVRMGAAFVCPSCKTTVRLRPGYFRVITWVSLALSTLLAYASGWRAATLVVLAFVGLLPTKLLVGFVTLRLFRIDLEPAGDVQSILYGSDADATQAAHRHIERADESLASRTESSDPPSVSRSSVFEFFRGLNEPRSFEGYLLQAGALVLLVASTWLTADWALESFVPGLEVTRTGPKGFPVTAHLGDTAMSFTNGSDTDWTCQAELISARRSYGFSVAARSTRNLAYVLFDPAGSVTASAIRRAATHRIDLTCAEPSGISHFAVLD